MRTHLRRLVLLSILSLALGCPTLGDDDDDVIGDCPAEDRFTSTPPPVACDENFCGEPQVWPATGSSPDTFRLLEDGDSLPITWGVQGGYHVDLAVRTVNLCSVVWLDFELFDTTGGTETLIHRTRRHVQAVRENSDPEVPSQQRWWVEQFRFPCAWWPNDADRDPECADPSLGWINEVPLLLRIAAEDHNVADELDENGDPISIRTGVAEVEITAECCAS